MREINFTDADIVAVASRIEGLSLCFQDGAGGLLVAAKVPCGDEYRGHDFGI